MDLSNIKPIPDHIIKAIGNTLIHSLWQGLMLAAVGGLIIVCTRRSTPTRRYNLLIAALVLFAAATAATFMIEYNQASSINKPAQVFQNNTAIAKIYAFKPEPHPAQTIALSDKVSRFLNKNANNIVLIWFLVVCARSMQLLTGLHGLYHFRRKAISPIDKRWADRVQELAVKLGIRQVVSIAESGIAKVPMVIGHLKPLILIPMGLITAMPPEEIEAILVHELAHIRRRDYLVNLLQSLMEIVFFFNPAVLWISALIKTERENCCDDIAVAQTSSKVNYIRALVSCQEYQLQAPAYAMALRGGKGPLVGRVKRILSNSNQSLNMMEKSLLAICLVMAGLLTAAFSNADKISKLVITTTKAITHVTEPAKVRPVPVSSVTNLISDSSSNKPIPAKKDTTVKGKFKIYQAGELGDGTSMELNNKDFISYLYKENGVLYQLNYKESTLNSVQINSKTLSPEEVVEHQPELSGIMAKHDHDIAALKQKIQLRAPLSLQTSRLTVNPARLSTLTDSNRTAAVRLQGLSERQALAIGDSVNQAYKKSGYMQPYKKTGYMQAYQPATAYTTSTLQYKAATTEYASDKQRNLAINDMIKDGLIQSKDNLSFKLSTEEFILNGKKQPDEVYKKYRAKYVKATGHGEWSWFYNYDTSQRSETNKVTDAQK